MFPILKTTETKGSTSNRGGQSVRRPGFSENDFSGGKRQPKGIVDGLGAGSQVGRVGMGSGNSLEAVSSSQRTNRLLAQPRANMVLAGGAGAGAEHGGGTTGVTVHVAALHWGPDWLATGERGAREAQKW